MDKSLRRDTKALSPCVSQSTDEGWVLDDLASTYALGRELAHRLTAPDLLLLQGPLGVGKTSLVQGLARALGIMEPITSPTFALAQHYSQGKPPLVHLDLYRLDHQPAADDLLLQEEEEARSINALVVVEWPERLSLALGLGDAWHLQLTYHPSGGRLAQLHMPDASRKFLT
ncbi:tRNA (adenosine(37)-N6)-threonylcarbamoyltransferase complex ATPase subunit type 1 TsaE [cyanobiont of Ornithocercus magnificus]|nr:tRNA (adenosine(37)-N6)-threonylcarbamoyltransferase complex ATPase subunit type 1 TsaE [cyanobiont of Ornithocercus magnificus]